MIMKCSLSNVITEFSKGHPPVSISTGLFFFDSQGEEKEMILDIILIYCIDYLTKNFT